MMKQILTALILTALHFQLTGQGQSLVPGKVIDTVRCQANERQSYALYVPKKYDHSKPWPVIFFYDPAARGSLPVNQYRSLAEKYQCILVGSNNSRNGPFNVTQESEQAIVRDVGIKLSIDKSRLFISGFSGGARAAVFISQQRKIYAGIIACGAAFPVTGKLVAKDDIPFIEVIGNEDMNFTEAVEAEDYLTGISYPHALLFFQGTHAWPPVRTYDHAIFWQLYRSNPPTKSVMTSYDSSLLSKAQQEVASGDLWIAHWNLKSAISFSPRVDSLEKTISGRPEFVRQEKSLVQVLKSENDLIRQFYARLDQFKYATHDSAFKEADWKSMLTNIKKYSNSRNIQEVHMSERLTQQVRIASFEAYKQQFQNKRYLQASFAARLLVLTQPDPNSYLGLARAYVKMDRRKEAVQALSKSAELGLSDKSVLDQPDFSTLDKEKKFIAVKQQVELNAKKSP
jgi:predicted esterase